MSAEVILLPAQLLMPGRMWKALPSVVLTHLNGDHWAARLPLPVTIAVCSSPPLRARM